MRMEMKRRIIVNHGDVEKIARSFQCTREMASKALNYKKDTELAKKIRYVAKARYGGVEIGSEAQR